MKNTERVGLRGHNFLIRALEEEITKQNYPAAENCKAVI